LTLHRLEWRGDQRGHRATFFPGHALGGPGRSGWGARHQTNSRPRSPEGELGEVDQAASCSRRQRLRMRTTYGTSRCSGRSGAAAPGSRTDRGQHRTGRRGRYPAETPLLDTSQRTFLLARRVARDRAADPAAMYEGANRVPQAGSGGARLPGFRGDRTTGRDWEEVPSTGSARKDKFYLGRPPGPVGSFTRVGGDVVRAGGSGGTGLVDPR